MEEKITETDFTMLAWESLYDTVDDARFDDKDASLIYTSLKKRMKPLVFGDYLKRYIYRRAELTTPFSEVPDEEYQEIIKYSFSDTCTPAGFEKSTSKLSQLSKNWLNQRSVKRKVVFLLGFGLSMKADDVNMFLTKALLEPSINPKDPFEVICFYCYKNGYNFLKFEQLYEQYGKIKPQKADADILISDRTIVFNTNMLSIDTDVALAGYLATLKETKNASVISLSAKRQFDVLYERSRTLIAEVFSTSRNGCAPYKPEDITEGDFEHVLCSAVPKDRHGNLTPSKDSKLSDIFGGKRISRHHLFEVVNGKIEPDRFDIITLNFLIFALEADKYPNARKRYDDFFVSTNEVLSDCLFGELYVQNPYECFVLMCILSQDPLGTYADVWELSYEE